MGSCECLTSIKLTPSLQTVPSLVSSVEGDKNTHSDRIAEA